MDADEPWVEVVPYDPRWAEAFEREAAVLRPALGTYALGVDHFGSTAVPGLSAKPIVDVLVGTAGHADPDEAVAILDRLGYQYLGEDGRRPGRFFWRRRGGQAFNISAVPIDGSMWASNLAVRDFLRTHDDWAAEYAAAKRRSVAGSGASLLAYQDGKREFVDRLRREATRWRKREH
jgi:GrpB-like predicted nucleotidyltransferase (UPF0157 family)